MIIITLLPLAPLLLVFLQKKYEITPLNFLVLVCLMDLMKGLSDLVPLLHSDNQYTTRNVFSLLTLVALVQLFKTSLGPATRTALNVILTAFLSSLVTWFIIKGWQQHGPVLDTLESGLIIAVILLSVLPLIKDDMLQIFSSPLFWIAGGSLFYLIIALLVEWVGPCCQAGQADIGAENQVFLSLATLVKYALFIKAILVCRPAGETIVPGELF